MDIKTRSDCNKHQEREKQGDKGNLCGGYIKKMKECSEKVMFVLKHEGGESADIQRASRKALQVEETASAKPLK